MKNILVAVAATFLLASCINSYQQNYRQFVDTQTAPNLQLLAEGATPLVTKSNNVRQDVAAAKSNGYIVVGESSFNDELQSLDNLIAQAKTVKATMVIYSSKYTDTQLITSNRYVPRDTTTYTSGKFGDKKYEETSTTSGLVAIPQITEVRNFEQQAVFLVRPRK